MTQTTNCPNCGARNTATARFCGECGTRLGGAPQASPAGAALTAAGNDVILKWFIAGTVVLAIHAAAIIIAVRGGGARPAPAQVAGSAGDGSAAPLGTQGTTDLSSMTPREAADRLYDRIARASESGDTAQLTFFGPMAIQAYDAVRPLDADARLHVGLIQLALGNPAAAAAQADSLIAENRGHLFGPLLRARAAEARNDRAGAAAAWREFLRGYDSERARALTEYDQHGTMLDQARVAGRAATGGS